jgi:TonB family protein
VTLVENRQVRIGVVGSLAIHALLFLALAWMWGVNAAARFFERQSQPVEDKEVTLLFPEQIVEVPAAVPPAPAPVPVAAPKAPGTPFIRMRPGQSTAEPLKADYLSDRNTVAAASKAAYPDANRPMPSSSGDERPVMGLAARAAPEAASNSEARKIMESLDKDIAAKEMNKLPLEVKKPADPAEGPQVEIQKAMPMPQMKTDATPPPPERNSLVKGSITEQGEDSVNAVATPLGKHCARMIDLFDNEWQRLTRGQAVSGEITVSVLVSHDGKVQRAVALEKSSDANALLERLAFKAIEGASQPATPDDLRAEFSSEGIYFTLQFIEPEK